MKKELLGMFGIYSIIIGVAYYSNKIGKKLFKAKIDCNNQIKLEKRQ
jgi:hypothetical protein